MASIQYVVSAQDAMSAVLGKIAASADGLDKQLADLSKRVATPEVTLKDSKFAIGMLNAAKRIDKLNAMVASPEIEVDGAKAQTEILRISAMLDRLDAKHVNVGVGVHRSVLSRLSLGMLGGAGGAGAGGAGTAASAAGGGLPLLGGLGTTGGIAAVAAGLTALPFIAQAAAGGITLALGGALTGIGVLSAAQSKQVRADWSGLFKNAGAELHQVSAPFIAVLKQISQVGQSVLPTIMMSLVAPMKILAPAFQSVSDSLLRAFAQPAVANSLLAVGRAFAGILKALAPQLPGDIKDIAVGITRIANSIQRNRGQFAAVISFFFKATGFALSMVSALANVAGYIEKHFIPALMRIKNGWDQARHQTAVILDGMRHQVAHVWDMIFNNTLGRIERGVAGINHEFDVWRHDIAVALDWMRHIYASEWDTIWRNTVTRVQRGIADVVRFFKALPGRAINALQGFGTLLYNFGHMAMTKLWNGLKTVFGDVWNWFKSLPGKLLHAIGVNSPPDWAIQAGKHIMGGILKGITSRKTELQTAFRSSVALGGDALANQKLARSIFPWGADQWGPFVNLVMAESGFNRFARNPSSGAYGIPQALPPSKLPFAGQAAGGSHAGPQLSWMFNYIAQRYSTPANAWAHELSAHWYGSGFHGTVYRPTVFGAGERGPERVDVTPMGQGRGAGVTINNNFGPGSVTQDVDVMLISQRQSFQITAAGLGS